MDSHKRSGGHTPFQDISNTHNQDPKEQRRQKGREYYAQNREEILRKQREARKQKKAAAALQHNAQDDVPHTPDPKSAKRQYDRERYSQNKEEISKRQRQAREDKKFAASLVNHENMVCSTPAAGQSDVIHIQCTSMIYAFIIVDSVIWLSMMSSKVANKLKTCFSFSLIGVSEVPHKL